MAESWQTAFGRYLKTLRLRKGLSLQDVCSLSQAFAQTIEKGYLSRCENGYQGPSFAKIIPLSRIYGVASDVLIERLELDMELEKVVGDSGTDGMQYKELVAATKDTLARGMKWNAYGFARAAVVRAAIDPPRKRYRDVEEQVAAAQMTYGTMALTLGRSLLALHEFRYLESSDCFETRLRALLLERLSLTLRLRGDLDASRRYAQNAADLAKSSGDQETIGYVYSNLASHAYSENELEKAAEYFDKAHSSFRGAGLDNDCSRSLFNLGLVFFDQGRDRAARRALESAVRADQAAERHRGVAVGRIVLGDIETRGTDHEAARRHWKSAAEISKKLKDKTLQFRCELRLFRQAHTLGEEQIARSIRRRLSRLSNWVPKTTPELNEFRDLISANTERH